MSILPFQSVLVSFMLGFSSVFACGIALAQDARVRAHLRTQDAVWVGQKLTVVIELLAPGYFSSAPSFELPDPQGVLLMPPAEHPVVSNETTDGAIYTIQRHELAAYAMHAGAQSVPTIKVRFAYKSMPLDDKEISATVTTDPLPFKVNLPPGAEGLGQIIRSGRAAPPRTEAIARSPPRGSR
jgi:hypothetical protein